LVDERRHFGKDVKSPLVIAADVLSRLERTTAYEDSEATKEGLLCGVQEVVTPVDRRAQRLLAGGPVSVTRRTRSSKRPTSASSRSRPTKLVRKVGSC
jgi:hypothetical protein